MNNELHQIITADGLTYSINKNTPARYLLSTTPGGWGLPPIDWVRTRTYQQHGESELAYYLQTRRFALSIGGAGCNRNELWQLRRNVLEAVRPNRSGQLTFVFTNSAGNQYAIKGRALSPNFPPSDEEEWYEFGYQDELEIEAIEPWFFNYVGSSVAGVAGTEQNWVFPFSFDGVNLVFGSGNFWGNVTINYTGSWFAYPKITIHGQASNIILTHEELGYRIAWLGSLTTSQSLVIDLRNNYSSTGQYEGVLIYNSAGANQFNYLDPLSNLLQFAIYPDGEVAGGVNTIRLDVIGADSNTAITVEYNTCYIGI